MASTTNTTNTSAISHYDKFGKSVNLTKGLMLSVEYKLGGEVVSKYVRDDQLGVMVLDNDLYQLERNFEEFKKDKLGNLRVSHEYMLFVLKHFHYAAKDVSRIIQVYDGITSEHSRLAKPNWQNVLVLLKARKPMQAKQLLLTMDVTCAY
jgi:hypothetical protein